jgi:hypothetical protein
MIEWGNTEVYKLDSTRKKLYSQLKIRGFFLIEVSFFFIFIKLLWKNKETKAEGLGAGFTNSSAKKGPI